MKWPASRPDFTRICGDCFWICIKDFVFEERYHSNDELKADATTAFGTISPALLRKISHGTGYGVV